MRIINEHDEYGKYDDKKTFYTMLDIIEENADKKVLLCFKKAQAEVGSLYKPPITVKNKNYYIYTMHDNKYLEEIYSTIAIAIEEEFDIIIIYRPDLTYEDARLIEEVEKNIQIILPMVREN